jgi:hypothetical protein
LQISGRKLLVDDLSAGGLAVMTRDMIPGQRVSGLLRLPAKEPIPLLANVVKVLPNGRMALEIEKIKPDGQESIHQYVLERQKKELEEKRAREKAAAQRRRESEQNQG